MKLQDGDRSFRFREMFALGLVVGMLASTNVAGAVAQCTPAACDDNDPCTDDTCDPGTGSCVHTPTNCDDGSVCTVDSCSPGGGIGVASLLIGHDTSQLERQYQKNGTFVQTWGAIGHATGAAVDGAGVVYICNPAFGANVIERRGPGNVNLGTITATVGGQFIEDLGNFGGGYILAGTAAGDVFRIDTATGADVLLFSTGNNIIGVTYDGTNIWTTGGFTTNLVYQRDLAGNVLATFNTGQSNVAIGYDPDDGTLWIGHTNGQVTHHTQLGTFLGGFPTAAGGYVVDGLQLGNLAFPAGCRHTALDGNNTDPCTDDLCDPVSGCFPPPHDCDDGNACTDDLCVPETGCVFTSNNATCDDGNFCTTGDTCSGGTCQPGTPVDCNDGNVCTTDGCFPRTGCTYVDNTNPCDDGNACTIEDACLGGTCHPGVPFACNDNNVCTADTCDPTSGCVYTNITGPCDDGNACTTGEVCVAGTCQLGVGVACTPSDQCHLAGICDPGTGLCSNPTAPNGTTCSDGNPCTLGDRCVGGVCAGVTTITTPAETHNLAAAADKSTYTWSEASDATAYDAVRGDVAALPVGSSAGGEVCFENLSAPALVDAATPAPHAGFWYLSRARNPCGPGPIGAQSNGTMRVTTACP